MEILRPETPEQELCLVDLPLTCTLLRGGAGSGLKRSVQGDTGQ